MTTDALSSNSTTADRLLVNGLALGGAGGSAGAVWAGANPAVLAGAPVALGVNRLVGNYLRSGGYADRVINSSINPTGNMLAGGSPYVAAGAAEQVNALDPEARRWLRNPLAP